MKRTNSIKEIDLDADTREIKVTFKEYKTFSMPAIWSEKLVDVNNVDTIRIVYKEYEFGYNFSKRNIVDYAIYFIGDIDLKWKVEKLNRDLEECVKDINKYIFGKEDGSMEENNV